jgi:hypothetical protein
VVPKEEPVRVGDKIIFLLSLTGHFPLTYNINITKLVIIMEEKHETLNQGQVWIAGNARHCPALPRRACDG